MLRAKLRILGTINVAADCCDDQIDAALCATEGTMIAELLCWRSHGSRFSGVAPSEAGVHSTRLV
jgi:hypothetical protein